MKTLLDELNEKIKFELHEAKDDKKEKKEKKEDENDEKKGALGLKRSSASKSVGLVKSVFNWEIDYSDLKNKINDDVRGVVVTKQQAESIFKVVKKMIEHPEDDKKDK